MKFLNYTSRCQTLYFALLWTQLLCIGAYIGSYVEGVRVKVVKDV